MTSAPQFPAVGVNMRNFIYTLRRNRAQASSWITALWMTLWEVRG